jgi:hypothetical protein
MNESSTVPSSGPSAGAILATAQEVLTDPRGFFSKLPPEGGLEEPGIFAAAMLVTTGILQALLSLVGLYPAGFFASLILTPIFGAIGLAIGAAILMFASRALGGVATYESSLRIVAYAAAILPIQALLSIVPYLPLLASAYGIYITILAVIAVHRTPEDRTWKILGGIGAALLLISLMSMIAGRRAAHHLDTFGERMQKSAEEMEKATEQWRQQMEKATEQMKRDLDQGKTK